MGRLYFDVGIVVETKDNKLKIKVKEGSGVLFQYSFSVKLAENAKYKDELIETISQEPLEEEWLYIFEPTKPREEPSYVVVLYHRWQETSDLQPEHEVTYIVLKYGHKWILLDVDKFTY